MYLLALLRLIMSDLKGSSFRKTFGTSDLNLWETVDAIMMDLVGKSSKSLTDSADDDIDSSEETRMKNLDKDKELEGMMQNLDSLIDDLNDLGDFEDDEPIPTTKVRPVYPERTIVDLKSSGEEDQFLQKENPFDAITQGLREEEDVALFSTSSGEERPLSSSTGDLLEVLPQYPHHLPDIHRMGLVPDKYPSINTPPAPKYIPGPEESPSPEPTQDYAKLTPTLPTANGKTSPRMVSRSSRMIGYSRKRSNSNPDLFSTSPDSLFSQSPSPSPVSKSIFFPSPPTSQSSPTSASPIANGTSFALGQHRAVAAAANKPLVGSPSTGSVLRDSGSRLIFGKESGEQPVPKSPFSIGSTRQVSTAPRTEMKDRNAKIKQLRDLLRRYNYIANSYTLTYMVQVQDQVGAFPLKTSQGDSRYTGINQQCTFRHHSHSSAELHTLGSTRSYSKVGSSGFSATDMLFLVIVRCDELRYVHWR